MGKTHPVFFFLCLGMAFLCGCLLLFDNPTPFLWFVDLFFAIIFSILTVWLGWGWLKVEILDMVSALKNISIRTPEYLLSKQDTDKYRAASTLTKEQAVMVMQSFVHKVMVHGETEDEDEQNYKVDDWPYLLDQAFVTWFLNLSDDMLQVYPTSRINEGPARKKANALVNHMIRKGWADGKITTPEDPRNQPVFWAKRREAYRRLKVPIREAIPQGYTPIDWQKASKIEREADNGGNEEE
jgi:hypothetical protein